ncbi:hypothetical protein SIN8267_02026 [Sinobacterium norvegicum]|uniref:Probable membrane transporter protein n=1 Tax=Sinobacterium norvegicum TaxID=1641715 RepID=A0ABM9AFD3_9GAMM|nr:sulfite exporter TauE/SafE family protein [Sinobacterium norvegicum]CAH0991911.1 hypothetical protein SIN8267_02026 [Sinobacterium norvegicum]
MINEPIFYLYAIPAVLIFGMAKGGFGGGISVISVPLLAMVSDPVTAAAIMLPLLVAMDLVALWSFRGQYSKQQLAILLPGAVLGVIIGSFGFRYLSEDAIRLLIGVISLAFCANYYLARPRVEAGSTSRAKGGFWGLVAGFTSFGIHAGAPPVNIYLLPLKLDKKVLMGTMAVFFAVINIVKLIPYAWLGQLNSANLWTSLILLPLAPIGVRLGYYLLHRVDEVWVYRLCYFFLMVAGGRLLYQGVVGLIG